MMEGMSGISMKGGLWGVGVLFSSILVNKFSIAIHAYPNPISTAFAFLWVPGKWIESLLYCSFLPACPVDSGFNLFAILISFVFSTLLYFIIGVLVARLLTFRFR